MVSIDDLKPFERNPRKISEANYKKLVASIRKYGLHNRIKATSDFRIIGGHQRIKALRELGYSLIPILTPPDGVSVDEAALSELLITDNLHQGEFDYQILLEDYEFDQLVDYGIDEKLLQMNVEKQEVPTEADEEIPLQEEAISVLGDVWQMGDHRIICGSSTDADAVNKLLAGVQPMLMVTDPPYGVEYDPTWRNKAGVNKNTKKSGKVENDDRADWREAWALFPGNVAYVWHGALFAKEVAESLESCDFKIRSQIIWAKDRFALSRGDYHWHHEPCWYAVRENHKGNWAGDRKQSTLWNIKSRDDAGHGHSTQKPIECMKRPIENNSNHGQAVYEPFSGSGTTILAAEITGRICYAVELNPLYVDMAVRRWEKLTGKKAINAETGKEFESYGKRTDTKAKSAKKAG